MRSTTKGSKRLLEEAILSLRTIILGVLNDAHERYKCVDSVFAGDLDAHGGLAVNLGRGRV